MESVMNKLSQKEKEDLCSLIKLIDYLDKKDLIKIIKAGIYAIKKHRGQFRKSGEPYYIHPIEVAKILAGLKLDKNSIIAALLHDVVEDTDTSLKELEKKFGKDVAFLVDGLTKIEKHKFSSKEEAEAENFRKLILSMAKDFRVILIKIADRLHNMRTLDALRPDKQKRISEETLKVYAPLAARVGLWQIKNELEDMAFKYIHPEEYEKIKKYVAKSKKEQEKFLNKVIKKIAKELKEHNIDADINYRVKHIYGIYEKMQRKNLDLQQIYDIYGIRILVDKLDQCYGSLGVVHNIFEPLPDRFKDYIAKPKPNQYRALHTTVLANNNQPVEIQIKTYEMHEIAERGIAAHFKYKGGKFLTKKEIDQFIKIRDSLEKLLKSSQDTFLIKDIKENLDKELILDEIYVFTPKKDVIKLPIDATPIDFAYRIHTEVGHRVKQAKVNGSIVPLDFKLKSGDIVEIITGKIANPKRDWLKFVKTSKARINIKQFLTRKEREKSLNLGKNLLNKILRKIGKTIKTLTEEEKAKLIKAFNLKNFEELLIQIGSGKISVARVIRTLRGSTEKESKTETSQSTKEDVAIIVDNVNNILTKVAKCCMPIPGEEIVGIVLTGRGVSIHRKDCPNIQNILQKEPERVLKAVWGGNDKVRFPTKIKIISEDRPGILAEISTEIAKHNTNINSIRTRSNSINQTAILDLTLAVKNKNELDKIIDNLKKLKGIKKVYRDKI
jgi:GTP pyrophosphokinase